MADPIFWLGLSLLLVAVSLTAVLMTALPALRELARAARSAEKLFDTLSRELPPTLESIRLTGMEISNLTDGMNEGFQSANRVINQVDQSLGGARKQARRAQSTTRSLFVGFKAAWRTFKRSANPPRRSMEQLSASDRAPLEFEERYGESSPSSYSRDLYEEEWEYDYLEDSERSPEEEESDNSPDRRER